MGIEAPSERQIVDHARDFVYELIKNPAALQAARPIMAVFITKDKKKQRLALEAIPSSYVVPYLLFSTLAFEFDPQTGGIEEMDEQILQEFGMAIPYGSAFHKKPVHERAQIQALFKCMTESGFSCVDFPFVFATDFSATTADDYNLNKLTDIEKQREAMAHILNSGGVIDMALGAAYGKLPASSEDYFWRSPRLAIVGGRIRKVSLGGAEGMMMDRLAHRSDFTLGVKQARVKLNISPAQAEEYLNQNQDEIKKSGMVVNVLGAGGAFVEKVWIKDGEVYRPCELGEIASILGGYDGGLVKEIAMKNSNGNYEGDELIEQMKRAASHFSMLQFKHKN